MAYPSFEIRETKEIPRAFEERIADGYLYGDFQFATDSNRDSFLARGVFSCYRPVAPATELTRSPTRFHAEDWARLTYYSHKYKRRAFDVYTRGGSYYLTYHRFATRKQVEACYPRFKEFLELKLTYDPDELFQSNWYRHYKQMFGLQQDSRTSSLIPGVTGSD